MKHQLVQALMLGYQSAGLVYLAARYHLSRLPRSEDVIQWSHSPRRERPD